MAFSDNFDAIKNYATNAAQAAAKKTKKLASIAKANIAILAEEDKVKKAQLELGKVYYKDFILNEEPDQAEYLPWCDKITESLKLIDNLKMEIELARQPEVEEEEPEKDIPVVDEEIVEEAEAVAEEVAAVVEDAVEAVEEAAEVVIPEIVVVEEPVAEVVEEAAEAVEEVAEAVAEEVPVEEVPAEDAPAEE